MPAPSRKTRDGAAARFLGGQRFILSSPKLNHFREPAIVAITLKIRDDRTLRNPSPLDFVETHGGTNANETPLARHSDREWCCLPFSGGIHSDWQSGSKLG